MAPTVASTVVDRPAAQVFAYTTDPDLVVTDLREFFGSIG